MEKTGDLLIPRRTFIASVPLFLFGGRLLGVSELSLSSAQIPPQLPEDLTPEELTLVENSVMAKDLKNYFGQGYSCAESLWMVSLNYLQKPKELIWIACGFGGGMAQKDLCGFLTSGYMAIGLSAGMLEKERDEAKQQCGQKVREYWKWWASKAPHRCAEIRKEDTSPKVCSRLGQLAAAKVEELIKRISASS